MAILFSEPELQNRVDNYAVQHGLIVSRFLGRGTQGLVFETTAPSAVKAHAKEAGYLRERDAYLRLEALNIHKISEFYIPRIYQFDDDLKIIEMSVVQPPFLLDFGGAYLDELPSHARIDDEWKKEMREQFEGEWDIFERALRLLTATTGIFVVDLNRGNMKLR